MQQPGQLLDADDLFSDLIGSSVLKSSSKAAAQPQQHGSSGPNSSNQPVRISSSGHAGPKQPVLPEPDLLDAALAQPNSNGSSSEQQQHSMGVSKQELTEVVTEAVQGVVDASLSKFVRSLRTVLEDMGRRIDATGNAANSLKETVEQLREDYESQAGNMHSRFTAVDLAVKEVERGVQSLRDKQELLEAQAMLAKLSSPKDASEQQHSKGSSSAEAAKQEPATPTAASAAALAPAASAPPAAVAPAAAAVMAPPALPQSAPPAPAAAPVAPPAGTAYAPVAAAPPAPQAPPAAGVPCAPPMAPGPPPPQQLQYGPPPPAPYAAPQGPPPPAPPVYQQPSPMQPQQPVSSSYMQMGPPPPQMQQQQPMAPPPGAGPPPPGYGPGPGPGPHHMGPPPPGAGPPGPGMYGPPPGHMQGSSGPQYPSAPTGAYPPPFRAASGPPPHGGRSGGSGPGGPGGPPQMASSMLPLDKIVSDIVAMGFSHGQVMGVVRQLQSGGQALEMNVIIDKLMAQSR